MSVLLGMLRYSLFCSQWGYFGERGEVDEDEDTSSLGTCSFVVRLGGASRRVSIVLGTAVVK